MKYKKKPKIYVFPQKKTRTFANFISLNELAFRIFDQSLQRHQPSNIAA
jgi:hypothetical protein